MNILENVTLADLTTMALGGPARYVVKITDESDIVPALEFARRQGLPVFVLGGGSNTLAHDEPFEGVILLIQILGVTIRESAHAVDIVAGAGENWDKLVKLTVDKSLHGIEALAGIPGTVGAAPVQNIGAYGQEIADTFLELRAYDTDAQQFVTLGARACEFSYRDSIFRGQQTGRYIITSVTFRLSRTAPQPPFYNAVENYFALHGITDYTPAAIRSAVLAIRGDKLPDPAKLPNTGSFFKNAIITAEKYATLLTTHPDMPSYHLPDGSYKVPTGWLIEQTGLKGQALHGMRVHDKNALVLINDSAKGYADLAAARAEIIEAVQDLFGITIEQEPLEIDLS